MSNGIEITGQRLVEWLDQYSDTGRFIYLHPYQLQYTSQYNTIETPITKTVLNVDGPALDAAKRAFFGSSEFYNKPDMFKRKLFDEIGLSPSLKEDLCRRPGWRKVIESERVV